MENHLHSLQGSLLGRNSLRSLLDRLRMNAAPPGFASRYSCSRGAFGGAAPANQLYLCSRPTLADGTRVRSRKGSKVTPEDLESPRAAADGRIRFDSAFASPSLEHTFRQRHLADDISLANACLVVVVLGGVVFTLIDYRLFRLHGQFYLLLGVRLL